MDFSTDSVDTARVAEFERRFQAGVARRAAAADRAGGMPPENWQDIVASGYLRAFHPRDIGGLGLDGVTQAQIMETLARACGGTYWSATMSSLVCGTIISTYGDRVEHRRLLDPLLGGDRLAAFAVVERTSGSDAGTYRTAVRPAPAGDGWVISGEKARITNGPKADLAVVFARFEGSASASDDWCYAFVDLRQDGVGQYAMPHMGLRAMPWGGITFDRVPIRREDVVPVRPSEFAHAMASGWLFISISAIALADNALRAAVEHASRQVAFGRPLAHMEGVQAQIAAARAEIDAARLLAWRAAWHRGRGRSVHELIAMLKPFATEMAVRVVQAAVQIHGSWALTPGHEVERLYRDAPMNVIGGFTSNRLRELVAAADGLDITVFQEFDWLSATGLLDGPTGLAATGGARP